jgi:hypothetical protein
MSIQINAADEISKLLAFIRAQAKANFEVSPELIEACFEAMRRFAKDHGLTIDVVTPSDERVVAFGGGGMLVGAAAGYVLGAIPGAIVGAVAGGLAGFALAHVTICIRLPALGDGRSPAVLQLV